MRIVGICRALAALAVFTLSLSSASGAADPYTIDVIINGTGANAYVGQTETEALKVFEKWTNAHGGINGRPVHFAFYDDQTEPRVAVQLTSQLSGEETAGGSGIGTDANLRRDGAAV